MSLFRLVCLLLSFLLTLPAIAAAQVKSAPPARKAAQTKHRAPVDRALEAKTKTGNARVIVRYRAGARTKVRQALAGKGARVRRDSGSNGAIAVDLPLTALEYMRGDPDVMGISLDAIVRAGNQDPVAALDPEPSSVDSTTSLDAWTSTDTADTSQYDGQGLRRTLGIRRWDAAYSVGVAIIDSGIYPSADLDGRISAFYDFTSGSAAATAPVDGYGHGTHIAGLIAGNGSLSGGKYVGVARGARLIGLRVLNDQGAGYTSDVIAAIDFAVANRVALGTDVINLSLGPPIYEPAATDPLVQAVESAVAAGIVVVASAGNHGLNPITGAIGYAGITSPGNAPSVITVGSLRTKATPTRTDDEISLFSSRGPTWYDGFVKPDILAPGQALAAISHPDATLFANPLLHADTYPYIKLSGTSMASGVAAGVAALMIEAHRLDEGLDRPLSPNVIKAVMQFTAIPVADDDLSTPAQLEQGTGGLNARGAMQLTQAIDPTAPLDAWWMESFVDPSTYLFDATLTWAQYIIWGAQVVSGDTIKYNQLAWSQDDDGHIVWGDDDDGHIVWGDSFIQGPNLTYESFGAWSTQIVWADDDDAHIVWVDDDGDGHIVWGDDDEHIVWGDLDDEHIVWGDDEDEHVVWGDTVGRIVGSSANTTN